MGANICQQDNTLPNQAYTLNNGAVTYPGQTQQPQQKYAAVANIPPITANNVYKPQILPVAGQAATIPMSKPIVTNLTAADIQAQPASQKITEKPAPVSQIASHLGKPTTTTSISSGAPNSSMRRDFIRESLDNSIYLGLNTPSLLTSQEQSQLSSQLLQTQHGLQSMVDKMAKK